MDNEHAAASANRASCTLATGSHLPNQLHTNPRNTSPSKPAAR